MEIEFVITAFVSAVIGFIFGFVGTRLMQYKNDKEIFERINKKVEKKIKDKIENNVGEDKTYYICYDYFNNMAPRLTEKEFQEHICRNNEKFSIYDDMHSMKKLLICKNKPSDLPLRGITFKEKLD